MTRANEWAGKVLALLKGRNIDGALAQIKVAPSVKDLKQLRAAIAAGGFTGRWPGVDETVADQIDALAAPRLHRSP
ncbi:MAG: hypothetical protein HYX47_03440 [Burkholderiales bacterium]|nr:hypothetical protein [Burkholderiales bacterium]